MWTDTLMQNASQPKMQISNTEVCCFGTSAGKVCEQVLCNHLFYIPVSEV